MRTLARIAEELSTCHERSLHLLDSQRVQLELLYRELVAVDVFHNSDGDPSTAVGLVREALSIIRDFTERHGRVCSADRYQAPIALEGTPGRPSFYIPREQLVYLLENRFSCPQIAEILGVSLRTVRRRMTEYGLTSRMFYTNISDQQLDEIVREIQHAFPTCGNTQMQGHLISRGIRVQQHRIRESQRRIDPAGSVLRQLRIIGRRRYHVSGPGALWHIDGNHKLIRYTYSYMCCEQF